MKKRLIITTTITTTRTRRRSLPVSCCFQKQLCYINNVKGLIKIQKKLLTTTPTIINEDRGNSSKNRINFDVEVSNGIPSNFGEKNFGELSRRNFTKWRKI